MLCLICRKHQARTGDLFCRKCAMGEYPDGGLHRRLYPMRKNTPVRPPRRACGTNRGKHAV